MRATKCRIVLLKRTIVITIAKRGRKPQFSLSKRVKMFSHEFRILRKKKTCKTFFTFAKTEEICVLVQTISLGAITILLAN